MDLDVSDSIDKLKFYKENLTPENLEEFKEFIEGLKNNLPELYKDKINPIEFFEETQEFSSTDFDDLPF